MQIPADIQEYLQLHATELGERILSSFPPLQGADDDLPPLLGRMLRRPYLGQALAIADVSKRWTRHVMQTSLQSVAPARLLLPWEA